MSYRVWKDVPRANDADPSTSRLLFSVDSPTEGRWVIERLRARERDDPTVPPAKYGLEILSTNGWTEWAGSAAMAWLDGDEGRA